MHVFHRHDAKGAKGLATLFGHAIGESTNAVL